MFELIKSIFKKNNEKYTKYVLELNKDFDYNFEQDVYNTLITFWPH
jgi:hypothetical protein